LRALPKGADALVDEDGVRSFCECHSVGG